MFSLGGALGSVSGTLEGNITDIYMNLINRTSPSKRHLFSTGFLANDVSLQSPSFLSPVRARNILPLSVEKLPFSSLQGYHGKRNVTDINDKTDCFQPTQVNESSKPSLCLKKKYLEKTSKPLDQN